MPKGIYKHKKPSIETRKKMSESHSGIKNHFYGKHHSYETKKILSNRLISEETRKKMSISRLGKRFKNILKRSEIQKYDYEYRIWMKSVKIRDGWKCSLHDNNCTNSLQAHHILPWRSNPESRYDINNGITLCTYHHPRKRSDEDKLRETFIKIIKLKNGKN